MKKSILLIVLMYFSNNSFAQLYEAGFSLGGSNYVGDVGRTNYIYPNNPSFALFFKYNYNPRIALRATYSYLPIKGDDLEADTDFKNNRGFSFTNTVNELAIGLEYNFYEYNLSETDKSWTPYILLELAAFNSMHVISETSQGQYNFENKNSFALPIGVGFKSRLAGAFAFAVEAKFRYTFDDDLDFTTTSIESLDFGGNNSDWYMFTGVSLIYTFGRPPCYTKGL